MAYCVEKLGFSAAVLGLRKIDLSDRLRIDDRKSRKGRSTPEIRQYFVGPTFSTQ
jgi:hypothetical protein